MEFANKYVKTNDEHRFYLIAYDLFGNVLTPLRWQETCEEMLATVYEYVGDLKHCRLYFTSEQAAPFNKNQYYIINNYLDLQHHLVHIYENN